MSAEKEAMEMLLPEELQKECHLTKGSTIIELEDEDVAEEEEGQWVTFHPEQPPYWLYETSHPT